jgi:hypothetical protein
VDAGSPGGIQPLANSRTISTKVLVWRTESSLLRVEDTGRVFDNGDPEYRLILWDGDKEELDVPELIINDGTLHLDGSGGNYYYQFLHRDLIYRCHVIWLGTEDSPPGYFVILSDKTELLREPVLEADYTAR